MNTSAAVEFDWGLIRTFLAVLDAGSLLGAAKHMHTSQPTMGRQVAELERQLGVVLFERTGRGLAPTYAAHSLAASARDMQVGARGIGHALASQSDKVAGVVRISASVPVAFGLLPPLLARMRLALPQVQVELLATNAVSNLLQRDADIALRMVEPLQQTTVARRVGEVRLGAFANERYLARKGLPATPAQLLTHDFVADNGLIARGFEQMGCTLPEQQVVLRTDDMLAQWAGVRAGLGIGFVARYMAASEPQVQQVMPELPIPALPMWLVVHREVRTSARIRAVYDFLGDALMLALAESP